MYHLFRQEVDVFRANSGAAVIASFILLMAETKGYA